MWDLEVCITIIAAHKINGESCKILEEEIELVMFGMNENTIYPSAVGETWCLADGWPIAATYPVLLH